MRLTSTSAATGGTAFVIVGVYALAVLSFWAAVFGVAYHFILKLW